MRYYFQLQLRRYSRLSSHLGVNPLLLFVISLVLFVLFSKVLFYKMGEYAEWLYVLLISYYLFYIGNQVRIQFIQGLYFGWSFFIIRFFENLALALPFGIYLMYEEAYHASILLLMMVFFTSMIHFRFTRSWAIPTPFKRLPFEYIIGFRKSFLFLLAFIYILFNAVQVANYGLGLFSLLLVHLTACSYFVSPEKVYFAWIYSYSPRLFLIQKIKIAWIGLSCLSIFMMGILLFIFPEHFLPTIVLQFIGYILLSMIIVAKYASFPRELNIPQTLLIVLCFWFPPMVLLVFPIFYKKAIRNLKYVLQ